MGRIKTKTEAHESIFVAALHWSRKFGIGQPTVHTVLRKYAETFDLDFLNIEEAGEALRVERPKWWKRLELKQIDALKVENTALKTENENLRHALMAFVPASQWDTFWKLMHEDAPPDL